MPLLFRRNETTAKSGFFKSLLPFAFLLATAFAALGIGAQTAGATSWYNASWPYRAKITIDHTKVGSQYSSNLVPLMTSNTAPSGVASCSSFYSATSDAYSAFNGTVNSGWLTAASQTGTLGYQFTSGKVVTRYSITPWSIDTQPAAQRSPRTWTFEGSNNGSSWTVLDTQTNYSTWSTYVAQTFNVSNSTSYTYYRLNITANGGNAYLGVQNFAMYASVVAPTVTNFPVLVSTSSPLFAYTGSGGYVGKSNGGDILFTSSDGTTKLNHDLETYSSSTGRLAAWVNVPSLSTTNDTVLYLYYGKASAPDQAAPTAVWDSNYKAVYHMNAAGTTLTDSTSNGITGTVTGTLVATTTGGKTGDAQTFAASQYVTLPSNAGFGFGSGPFTISAWVNPSTAAAYSPLVSMGGSNAAGGEVSANYSGDLLMYFTGGSLKIGDPTPTEVGSYVYMTLVGDGGANGSRTIKLYDNGVQAGNTFTTDYSFPQQAFMLGANQSATSQALAGTLDEVRISNTARSADWMKTEFNNQNSPATFESTAAYEGVTTPGALIALPSSGQVALTWNAPSNPGGTITDYVIDYKLNATSTWTTIADGVSTATSYTVTGLSNGTLYDFRVSAVTGAGQGSPTDTVTSYATDLPGAPTIGVATAGTTQASVAFAAPGSTGGAPITSYTVTSSPGGITGTGTSSPVVVSGLSNGTSYTFTVTANNAAGSSPASSASNAVTPSATSALWYDNAWKYRTRITIDHTKVGSGGTSSIAYFPVLLSVTNPLFEYTGSGGHMEKSNGGDLVFATDKGVKISHEIETYSSTTGQLIAWASVPSLSTTTDTYIYAYYGNASAADQFNTTATWNDGGSSYYKGVWHLNGSDSDSSPTGDNLTTHNGTYAFASSTGIFSPQSLSLNGASNITNTASGGLGSALDISGDVTVSVWIKAPVGSQGGYHGIVVDQTNYDIFDQSDRASWYDWVTGNTPLGTHALNDNAWHELTLVRHAGVVNGTSLYMDGNTASAEAVGQMARSSNDALNIGAGVSNNSSQQFTGLVSEAHVSAIARSLDWVKTEYNNQSSPSTFSSMSSEQGNLVPYSLIATPGNTQISLSWTAPSNPPGGAITDYVIDYKLTASSTWNTVSDGVSTNTSVAITGLTNGTSYDFRVSAVTGAGQGNPSDPITATPFTIPGTPTNPYAQPGSTQIYAYFTPASNGGSPITAYTVTMSPGGITASGPSSPIIVPGLSNGTSYTFTVTATNAAGTSGSSITSNSSAPSSSYNWYDTSWAYRTKFTIDHTKVGNASSGNLANFPVLISTTTAAFAYTGSGGHVGKSNGGDIFFTAGDGTTKLSHDLDTYSSTTGQIAAWVKVPTLSTTTDTVLYMYYGKASAPDQATATTTWNGSYTDVWHFSNYNDSTVNAKNGAGSANTSFVTSGEIGSALHTTGAGVGASISTSNGDSMDILSANPATFEFWYLSPPGQGANRTFERPQGGSYGIEEGGMIRLISFGGGNLQFNTTALETSSWHQVAITYAPYVSGTTTNGVIYIDGVATSTQAYSPGWTSQAGAFYLLGDGSYNPANASMDEARISKGTTQSAGWIKTEYNNQSSPSTFESSAAEEQPSPIPTNVAATPGNTQISLSWTAPANPSGTISDYVIDYKRSSDYVWSTFSDGVSTNPSVAVTGLTNGTSYDFRVSAVMGGSQGIPSQAVTATPFTVPGAPTSAVATAGAAQASVSFVAPFNGGSPITSYTVTSSPGGFTATASTSSAPVIVTGLTNGTPYTFTVTATNPAGTGAASAASNSVTPDASLNWYNTIWGYRMKIIIDHTKVGNAGLQSSNLVPLMTSDTAPSGVASCSSYYTGNSQTDCYAAFNGTTYPGWLTNGTQTGTVGYQFTSGQVVTRYSITPWSIDTQPATQRSPRTWTFEGSNDGSSWTTLDTQTNYSTWSTYVPQTFNLSNTTSYTYYRLNVTANGGNAYMGIQNLSMYSTIPSPITNFPVLVSTTTPALKFTGSGGHVGKSNGGDILFTAGDGQTKIPHEIEQYSSSTGQIVSWVNVPSLSTTTDTTLYVYYGNASAADQANATSTWDANFKAVYHLNNATGVAPVDSTVDAITGTLTGAPTASTTSKVGAGLGFNGGSQYITLPSNANLAFGTGPFTISGWVDTAITTSAPLVSMGGSNTNTGEISTNYSGNHILYYANGIRIGDGAGVSSNSWTFATLVGDGGANGSRTTRLYANGVQVGTPSVFDYNFTQQAYVIGANQSSFSEALNGTADEMRFSNAARSADWIKTEYNNENSPGTFLAAQNEESIAPSDSPTSPSATPGNGQALVSWVAPTTHGTPVSDYVVDYKLSATSTWTTFADGISTATNATVTGLSNGSSYDFRVSAVTSAGTSAPSVTATAIPFTVPDAPTGVTATAGNAQATVAFMPPAFNGGSVITLYTVTSSPGGFSTTTTATSTVVAGLSNGTSYTFTVFASNAAGAGATSTPSNSVTPLTVPGAPTSVTAVPGNAQATVSFVAPVSNGGSPITLYTVTSSPGGFTATSTTATTTVVAGLSNGTAYTFTVRASNVIGTSSASSPSSAVTPFTVPNAPTSLSTVRGDSQVALAWVAPAFNGGSAITDYVIDYKLSATSTWSTFADGVSTVATTTVTGLLNGNSYDFRVSAANAAGQGTPSTPATDTPLGVPGAPTSPSAVRGNAQATVTFTAPGSNGGSAITSYTVTSSPGAVTATGSSSPITITGLTNGTAYTFTVVANNAAGAGATSTPSNSVTPATTPDVPTIGTATGGNASASVAFTGSVSNGGSAITAYTVTSSPGGFTGTGGGSPITVSGLANGSSYTFVVTATNAVGTSASSSPSNSVTPATVPDAPVLNPGVATSTQVALTWTAPAIHGSAITDYVVDFKAAASSTWTTFADGVSTTTSATVTGLINGTSYNFRVSAVTAVGQGAASNIVTATPFTIPDAPTSVSAIPGDSQAAVSFSAPAFNGGSAITLYTIISSPGGFTATSSTATSTVVAGLTNGTSYTFTVTATNAAGTSTASSPSSAVTPSTVPDAPAITSTTPGNSQVSVVWTVPASHGAPITDYVIDYKLTATSTWATFADGVSSVASTTVTGLSNGSSYDFRVSAVNASGQGLPSATASSTPRTVPDAPTIGATTPGNGQVKVAFTAPAFNGGNAITSYTVTSSPGGFTASAGSSATSTTVTGLANGTAYTFTVTATNAAGTGAASSPSASTTPYTVPNAPTGASAVPGNAQATVSFTAPAFDGGNAITAYTVTSSPGGITATGTSSPIIITGLTNATSYTFTVTATNAAGTGAASTSTSPVTPATVPDAPTITFASPNDHYVSLIWSAPTTHGAAITDYVIDYKLSATTTWTTFADGVSTVTSGSVTGLTNGTSYDFRVSAVTAIGQGNPSAPVTVVPYTVAGAPAIGTATAGNAQATVSFTPSGSDGGTVVTNYTITSSPGGFTASGTTSPITVTGLANGTAYTFTVVASNAAGTSPASLPSNSVTPSTVPDAPTSLSATPADTQALLSWTAPAFNGGASITDYVIEYKLSATSTWTTFSDGTSTAASSTVTGLTNGTSYDFRVSAVNLDGQGAASSATSTIPRTVPSAPTAGAVTPSNGQVSVAFAAPASNGGSAITSYTVTSTPGSFTASGTSSPIIVTGLANGTAYTFTITASNAAGTSTPSAPTASATPYTVPDAPTSVSSVGGNANATVTFTPPAFNGGSAITSYTVTSSPGGITATGTSSPILVTGLTNGTTYTFTVTATNAAGTSTPSAPSGSSTSQTVPDAPTGASAVSGNGQAIVSFTLPASNGGATITGYTVTSTPGGITASGTSSPITVTGLTNGTSYTFTVTATNSVGTSTASSPTSAVIPSTVPDAPTSVIPTVGNGQIGLSWTAPASNGGAAITDYVVEYKLTATSTWSIFADGVSASIGATVTGLANGSSYDFRVSAVNVSGQGAASSVASATPITLAGAPTIGAVIPGNAQVSVAFAAPASNGGSAITSYVATSNPGGITASGTSSPILVTGLTNGTAYSFTVTAINGAGTSTPSSASATTTPYTIPGAPTGASAISGNALATVSFSAPASNGGSAITSYTVTSSPDGISATGTSSPIVVTGLANGTAYTFTVTASNAAGTSGASAPTGTVTPSTVPDAPAINFAMPSDQTISLSWSAPAIHGAAITDYVVDYKLTSTTTWSTFADGVSTVTNAAVNGLTNGTSYDFRVSAVTAVGQGAPSPTVAATPYTYAGAPTIGTATSGNGQAIITFTPPVSNGGSTITSYTVTSSPNGITASGTSSPITVTGLTNGTAYTFTVVANNTAGASPASSASNSATPSTVGGAPTSVFATPGNAQVALSWTAPASNGGASITDYIIEYKLTSDSSWSTFADGVSSATSTAVTGLTNGSSYDFRISAVNAAGQGAASVPVTTTPLTVPDAPTSAAATFGNGQASVAFAAPAFNGGSAIISYTVTSSPGSFTATGTSSPIVVTGLANGTSYTFTVTATNAAGTGSASSPSSSVTPASVADAPSIGSAVGGNAQASVSFTPSVSNGGAAITSYVVTSTPGNITASGSGSPITVTGLTNGTAYTFAVTAINAAGTSTASAASNSVTPITVPGTPTIGVVTPGNAQASVAFSAPASNGGSVITSYTVTSSPGGFTGTGTSSPIIVSSLTNGTSYTFTVKASNAAGSSPDSSASAATIPFTTASAPQSLVPTAGNALVSLTWSAPTDNGGSPITDYVVEYKLSSGSSWSVFSDGVSTVTTASVTGLTNGASYDFRVSAANAGGQGTPSAPASATPITVPDAPTSASAAFGNSQATVTFAAPASNGGSAITSYTVTSSPGAITASGTSSPIVITGLTNGTSYTFTVKATNAAGMSVSSSATAAITPATTPDAPTSPSATPGNAQAVVSFTAPVSNGGAAITSYTVTSSPGGVTATGSSSPIVITGLTKGTTYTFTVAATNIAGTGASSGPSSAVALAAEPGAPTNLAAAVLSNSIGLTWTAPASNGGAAISDYIVEYKLTTAGTWSVFADGTSASTSATVIGLSDGTSYDFRVSAVNVIGSSAPTSPITATPGEPAQVLIQGFPDLTATNISTSVRITNEGTAQYEYQYTWCITASSGNLCGGSDDIFNASNAKLIQPGENFDTTLNSIIPTPGNYWFHVKVLYGSQSSDAYQSITVTSTYPDAPGSVVAVPGNAQAAVSFATPNSDGGSPITNYAVTSSPGGVTATGTVSPIIVTGLVNGTSYTFTMTASNAVGTGAASAPSAVVTPITVPDAPSIVVAAPGNGQVSLGWSTPASDGGSPITDYVIEYKLSSDSSWITFADGISTATNASVTGLTNGASYDFRVSAVNAAGQSAVHGASASLSSGSGSNGGNSGSSGGGGGGSGGFGYYPPNNPPAASSTSTTTSTIPSNPSSPSSPSTPSNPSQPAGNGSTGSNNPGTAGSAGSGTGSASNPETASGSTGNASSGSSGTGSHGGSGSGSTGSGSNSGGNPGNQVTAIPGDNSGSGNHGPTSIPTAPASGFSFWDALLGAIVGSGVGSGWIYFAIRRRDSHSGFDGY